MDKMVRDIIAYGSEFAEWELELLMPVNTQTDTPIFWETMRNHNK